MIRKDRETRKIQTTGGSTYTVSLPKRWVEEMGINAGDEMAIEEQSSSLLLSPAKLKEEKPPEAVVEVGEGESFEAIKRKVLSLYLVGYNVIRVVSSENRLDPSYRNAVKELARGKLVGTEVISESIEEITLQTLLSYSELSAKGALRRMYRVASSMQDNAMLALEEDDKELAEDVAGIDDEVDRFQMYLIREIKAAIQNPSLIEEIGLKTARECLGYRLVAKNVERAGDHAASVARNVLEIEQPVDEEAIEMLREANSFSGNVFERAVNSLFDEEYEAAEDLIQESEEIYSLEEKINHFLTNDNPPEAIRIRLMLESIRRIAEYGSDIAEIVLNLTVDKGR